MNASRRVKLWKRRLKDPAFKLTNFEREREQDDYLSILLDPSRQHGLEVLLHDMDTDMIESLAKKAGMDPIPLDAISIDTYYGGAHAASMRLATGAEIVVSLDLVQIMFAWIRNLVSTAPRLSERYASVKWGRAEQRKIVVSRVARSLDLAAAPMMWTRQAWRVRENQTAVAEELIQFAERFVIAHEIAHLYVANDENLSRNPPSAEWRTLNRTERKRQQELLADNLAIDMVILRGTRVAAESGQEPMEGAMVGAVGSTLALAAIELLERYDDRYAHEQYPRAAIRRNNLRRRIAMIEGDGELLSSHVDDWEKAADPLAADALKVALRRRAVAHDAVTRLLTGEDGSVTWTQEEFTDAMRAVLRHSRSATLLALAEVYEHPDRFDAGVRRRVRTFVDEFLDEWQGEPLYAPFLDEIHSRGG